jgi:diamine N-acetyltransferase
MFKHGDLYIKAIEEDDLDFLARLRNDPDTWPYLGTLNFTNLERQKEWLKRSSLDSTQSNFILRRKGPIGGERIGFVRMDEIDFPNRSIRVGGDIYMEYRNQGYGKKMYDLIFTYCFDFLGMNRVWLLVLDYNKRAMELYRKVGMTEEGRLREAVYRDRFWHDYVIFGLLEHEYRKQYGSHS